MHYLIENYGQESVHEILTNTAQKVYRTIHEAVQRGDFSELAEFWSYYLEREGGEFAVEKLAEGIRLTVKDCPALRHLVKLEQEPDPILCDATRIFNEALAEGSPYASTMEKTGTFSCVQTFRQKEVGK